MIYRELIPQSLVINETNALSYGMKPSEIYRKSVLDARDVMCPPGQPCEYVQTKPFTRLAARSPP